MRITINPATLTALHTFTAAHASKDDITPIIVAAHVVVDGSQLRAIATDRYVAGILTIPNANVAGFDPADGECVIPAHIIANAAKTFAKANVIELSLERVGEKSGIVTFTSPNMPGASAGGSILTGNYPPVEKLFPTPDVELIDTPAGVTFAFDRFARLSSIRLPGDRSAADAKNAGWQLLGSMPPSSPLVGSTRTPKPTPLVVERHGAAGSTVRTLIQPNMNMR